MLINGFISNASGYCHEESHTEGLSPVLETNPEDVMLM